MQKSSAWSATLVAAALFGSLAVVPAQAAPVPTAQTAPVTSQVLLEKMKALLPADHEARLKAVKLRLGIEDGELRAVADQVIDPDQYRCDQTELTSWLQTSIKDISLNDLIVLVFSGALDVPTYDTLLFSKKSDPQTYGQRGEFTRPLVRTFADLKGFWDIRSRDIQLAAMHGTTLLNPAKIARTVKYTLGMTEENATEFGKLLAEFVDQPQFQHGRAPILTFNAFAYSALGQEEFPGLGVLPDKIVMGDGVLEGFAAIGLGDVAPQAILAHEFGHHIQYERDLFASPLTGPEATRRTELMADAFAAYYLTHKRGANLNWKRTEHFIQTFANVGDCGFTDPNHHGTPNQRTKAAEWGNLVALATERHGRVLPTKVFARLFERKLPELVAPDAKPVTPDADIASLEADVVPAT